MATVSRNAQLPSMAQLSWDGHTSAPTGAFTKGDVMGLTQLLHDSVLKVRAKNDDAQNRDSQVEPRTDNSALLATPDLLKIAEYLNRVWKFKYPHVGGNREVSPEKPSVLLNRILEFLSDHPLFVKEQLPSNLHVYRACRPRSRPCS